MSNVGRGPQGYVYTGKGNTASGSFQQIGTNSALTANGVLIAQGNSPFQVATVGIAGQVLMSNGPGLNPSFQSGGSSIPNTITGDSGGALSPTAGNWNLIGSGSTQTVGSGSTLTIQLTGLTNHALLVGAGTTTITKVGPTSTAGQVLQSGGASADPSFSTPTYPSASGTSRKILVSDGTNNVYSTETWAVPGTSGNILTSDGTNWTSATNTGAFTPNSVINLVDDFIGANTGTPTSGVFGVFGDLAWRSSASVMAGTEGTQTNPGIISTPSTTTGASGILLATITHNGTILLGGGALSLNFVFNIGTLSTVTNTYTLYVGMGSSTSAAPTDGVYFSYTNAVNSGKWVLNATNGGVSSTSNTSTTVATGFINLGITVNAAATLVTFFINGSSVGTLNSNIPKTTTHEVAPQCFYVWSAGTVPAGALQIDLFYMTQTLTTPR